MISAFYSSGCFSPFRGVPFILPKFSGNSSLSSSVFSSTAAFSNSVRPKVLGAGRVNISFLRTYAAKLPLSAARLLWSIGLLRRFSNSGLKDIKRRKGLDESEDLLDRAGRAELAAIEFKNTQAEQKLARQRIVGEAPATQVHREAGAEVRKTIAKISGVMPEDLEPEESIKKIAAARKKLDKPPTPLPPADDKVVGCSVCDGDSPVRHFGSKLCKSGSLASGGDRAHCTCDTCF